MHIDILEAMLLIWSMIGSRRAYHLVRLTLLRFLDLFAIKTTKIQYSCWQSWLPFETVPVKHSMTKDAKESSYVFSTAANHTLFSLIKMRSWNKLLLCWFIYIPSVFWKFAQCMFHEFAVDFQRWRNVQQHANLTSSLTNLGQKTCMMEGFTSTMKNAFNPFDRSWP